MNIGVIESMGRSFSEGEKKRILRSLKSLATERFAAQGIKGTTVEELTQGVGISKGAFYQFFPLQGGAFFFFGRGKGAGDA
jgi:hypothetical protein